ncbi:hypothetical protein [Gorillibacterium sp. CAU 1737]|uniref:hypothetical protein n=1 Tax=Gorillibacterium sp. CAU 1737 TaxID=3140362 RepID=UPI0032618742
MGKLIKGIRKYIMPSVIYNRGARSICGEEKSKRLVSLVEESRYLVVHNGSHGPHIGRENPNLMNDTTLSFLEENSISG